MRRQRPEEARNILLKELERSDTPELRRTIAEQDLSESRRVSAVSAISLDLAVQHCARAADVDPGFLDILT